MTARQSLVRMSKSLNHEGHEVPRRPGPQSFFVNLRVFCDSDFLHSHESPTLLPLPLTFGIIRVCLDPAGLFRNKDIRLVLMIRLSRRGARKQPHYRIVVIEKARARNGRPVEVVGTYNPRTNPASIEMKRDRVEYWVSKGAQMSERVNKLFTKTPAPTTAGSAA